MRAIYLLIAILGVTHGAMPQQRSPVYPSATTVGAPTSSNPVSFKPSSPVGITPAPAPPAPSPQIAQAREGSVPVDGASQAAGAGNVPGSSQNYLVYYYPGFRNAPVTSGSASQPQYPYPAAPEQPGSSILSWSGWRDVGYGGSALALVVVGGGLLYQVMYPAVKEVKARAMRELSEMKAEDAARMARSVLRAIERFRDMNAGN